ncbi:MAG: hypothetical protein COB37_01795 [Kordiimonadales bacterium]|nr:MAG: hypothetical protein COB37_01795 [Kordiimonadales bacterium]
MTILKNIRKATEADIAFIKELETRPANRFVYTSEADEHQANMANRNFLYLIGEDTAGNRLAYAMLLYATATDGNPTVEWRRIITNKPGGGTGRLFMKMVLQHLTEAGRAKRVWLDVFEGNEGAIRLYKTFGFRETGRSTAETALADKASGTLIILEHSLL